MDTTQHPATINIQGGITVYLTSSFKGWRKENVKQEGRCSSSATECIRVFHANAPSNTLTHIKSEKEIETQTYECILHTGVDPGCPVEGVLR